MNIYEALWSGLPMMGLTLLVAVPVSLILTYFFSKRP